MRTVLATLAAAALAGMVYVTHFSAPPVETHDGAVSECLTEDSGTTYPCIGESVVFGDDQPFPRN